MPRTPGSHQRPASQEEQDARRAAGKTQGRAGCKLYRVTMTFTDENIAFIRTAAAATGSSQTSIVNGIIQKFREENPDLFADFAKAMQNTDLDAAKQLLGLQDIVPGDPELPESVSERTLKDMDRAVADFRAGAVSDPVDPADF